jgi:hypothetical protein
MERGDRLFLIASSVELRHTHAAESQFRNYQALIAKFFRFHESVSWLWFTVALISIIAID